MTGASTVDPPGPEPPGPARRFLHVCWCCDDDRATAAFLVEAFGLRVSFRSADVPVDGAVLGFDRYIRCPASFVHDARGPRVGPAVEVQGWIDPPAVGIPVADPFRVGLRAVGLAVDDVDAVLTRLDRLGGRVLADTGNRNTRRVVVSDPRGVACDLVADTREIPGGSRLRHLRATVSDLGASLAFHRRLGFEVIARRTLDTAEHLGAPGTDGRVRGRWARLRLADEPFELELVAWERTAPARSSRDAAPRGPTGDAAGVPRQPNQRGLYRAALRVDDLDAALEALGAPDASDTGTLVRGPITVEVPGTPVPDLRVAFLADPDGIPFELVERPASAFRD